MENEQKKYWFFGSKLNMALLFILIILMVIALRIMSLNKDTYFSILPEPMTGLLVNDDLVINSIAKSINGNFQIRACGETHTEAGISIPGFYIAENLDKKTFTIINSKGELDKSFIFSNNIKNSSESCDVVFDSKYDSNPVYFKILE